VGNLTDKLGPRHVHGSVDFASLIQALIAFLPLDGLTARRNELRTLAAESIVSYSLIDLLHRFDTAPEQR
jgi:hypothetical protein